MRAIPQQNDDEPHDRPVGVEPANGSAKVARLDGERLYVWETGFLGAVLSNPTAVVVSRPFVEALAAEIRSGWRARDVEILDPPQTQIDGYVVLEIDDELDPSRWPSSVDGMRLWRFGSGSLFVSPALAAVLRERFPELSYDTDPRFAGQRGVKDADSS